MRNREQIELALAEAERAVGGADAILLKAKDQDKLLKAEAAQGAAVAALASVKQELANLDRAERIAEMDALQVRLVEYEADLARLRDGFVGIDRQIEKHAGEFGDVVTVMAATYSAARSLSIETGVRLNVQRPDWNELAQSVRAHVRKAREADEAMYRVKLVETYL